MNNISTVTSSWHRYERVLEKYTQRSGFSREFPRKALWSLSWWSFCEIFLCSLGGIKHALFICITFHEKFIQFWREYSWIGWLNWCWHVIVRCEESVRFHVAVFDYWPNLVVFCSNIPKQVLKQQAVCKSIWYMDLANYFFSNFGVSARLCDPAYILCTWRLGFHAPRMPFPYAVSKHMTTLQSIPEDVFPIKSFETATGQKRAQLLPKRVLPLQFQTPNSQPLTWQQVSHGCKDNRTNVFAATGCSLSL